MASPRMMQEDTSGEDGCPASCLKCWKETSFQGAPRQWGAAVVKWERRSKYREKGSEADPLHTDTASGLRHLWHPKEALSDPGLGCGAGLQRRERGSHSRAAGWGARIGHGMGEAEFRKLGSYRPELSQGTVSTGEKAEPSRAIALRRASCVNRL